MSEQRSPRSYSQVSSYLTCGEQFRLGRVEKLEEKPSTAAVAGKIIHSATEAVDNLIFSGVTDREKLQEAWSAQAVVSMNELVAEVAGTKYADPQSWKAYGRPTGPKPRGEDLAWFLRDGIPTALNQYVEWRLTEPWDVMAMPDGSPAIEIPFEFDLAGIPVRGYVDRVFVSRKTGAPLVVDLKSGLKPKNDIQLAVYSRALEEQLGQPFSWGAYYYGMKRGGQLTDFIDLSYWTDDRLLAIYGPADSAISQQLFIPNPGDACFHCPLTEHCSFFRSAI